MIRAPLVKVLAHPVSHSTGSGAQHLHLEMGGILAARERSHLFNGLFAAHLQPLFGAVGRRPAGGPGLAFGEREKDLLEHLLPKICLLRVPCVAENPFIFPDAEETRGPSSGYPAVREQLVFAEAVPGHGPRLPLSRVGPWTWAAASLAHGKTRVPKGLLVRNLLALDRRPPSRASCLLVD